MSSIIPGYEYDIFISYRQSYPWLWNVEKHGGNIEVKSEVGRGSEFVITLPKVS